MSSREKRLLTFFAIAGFLVLNFIAFNFLTGMKARLERERQEARRKLDAAEMFRNSSGQIRDEMDWLDEHEPESVAAQDAQTRLQQVCDREARSVGLTIVTQKLLEPEAAEGRHYHRAKVQFTVNGTEEALYRWLDRLNVPDQLRIATQLRLSPDKKDDTKIDCTATIEQWFVPLPPSA